MKERFLLDGSKIMYHADRVQAWLRGERIAPITIDCALTTHCSYRCVYCYGKMQLINQAPNLPRQVVMDFLDDAAEIGVKAISFVSDGESTCNPCLYEAIQHGKANGLDMALGTNGFLLKDEELPNILPCLTYLRFNISAGERDRYAETIDGVFHEDIVHTIPEGQRNATMSRFAGRLGGSGWRCASETPVPLVGETLGSIGELH